jgi:hypothetical protein
MLELMFDNPWISRISDKLIPEEFFGIGQSIRYRCRYSNCKSFSFFAGFYHIIVHVIPEFSDKKLLAQN